ncbi:MAG: hypothetical protein JNJ55_07240 [Betaproteobacteria bacterium]|nr:hypothetical protein [Betaproteobacteria bacterium]
MAQPVLPRAIRRQVALAAAKLVAMGEIDYRRALDKAADTIRPVHPGDWPTLEEIDTEVAAHFALFSQDRSPGDLQEIRRAALSLMCELTGFAPRLFGPVATGTAQLASPIWLELAVPPDESKELEIQLLNCDWPFEALGRGGRHERSPPRYHLNWQGYESVISLVGARCELRNKDWGARLSQSALAALLDADNAQR